MLGGERCITHDLWEDLGAEIHALSGGGVAGGRDAAAHGRAAPVGGRSVGVAA